MLQEMHLTALGVIDEAVLELGGGLTVLTGETGAGKTMVVTALGLLLGQRADPNTVRSGQPRAHVEGRFVVPAQSPAAQRVTEAGGDLDADADGGPVDLIVARTVNAEGRSRAHAGGRAVPLAVLGELAEELVAVHGQSEQLRLRSAVRQRAMLDRYAGPAVGDVLSEYRQTWQRWRVVDAELRELTERARERAAEAEVLRADLAELETLQPQEGEDLALGAEAERLAHAEDLRAAAAVAAAALSGTDDALPGSLDALALIAQARTALDQVRAHDPALAELADRLKEAATLVADIAAGCSATVQDIEADPARLAAVQERRAALTQFSRRHGGDLEQALGWAASAGLRLIELDGDQDRGAELRAEHEVLHAQLGELAARLSKARLDAAERLATAVTAELGELAMPSARLRVELSQIDADQGLVVDLGSGPRTLVAGQDGVDDVEILMAPHSGAPFLPVARSASGGELSRVMLGLEVVLGAADPVPTFVFDEVDSGVGGEAALGIGRRLARLSRHAQVLVVTHLPQVAAYADRHLKVTKTEDGGVTASGVRLLDDADRVRELARMLSGRADSDTARAHAEELWRTAQAERGTILE